MSLKHAERGTRVVSLFVEESGGEEDRPVAPERSRRLPPPPESPPSRSVESWFPLTGDVVLFSYDRKSFVSRFVSSATGSEWTHAAVICTRGNPVEDGGADEKRWLTPAGERLLLFESTSELVEKPMWDFLTNQRRAGIRVVDAYQRMHQRCVDEGCRAIIRRLQPHSDEVTRAVDFVQRKYTWGTYEFNPILLMESIAGSDDDGDAGRNAARHELLDKRKTAFCSQIVAEVFIAAGLLPAGRSARTYAPVDFAPGGCVELLLEQKGCRLSPPVEVAF